MKTKFGSIIVSASGKIGGHVACNGLGGSYLKTKSNASSKKTQAQNNIRVVLGAISSSWKNITDAERNLWILAAADYTYRNVFGDSKKLSAKALFVKLNSILLLAGLDTISQPADKIEIPYLTLDAITVSPYENEIQPIGTIQTSTALSFKIEATQALSNGITSPENYLKNIGFLPDFNNANAFFEMYVNKFGRPNFGDYIFFRITAIYSTGQTSIPVAVKANIVDV